MDEIKASEFISILEMLIRKYGNLAVTVNGLMPDITIDRMGDQSINIVEKEQAMSQLLLLIFSAVVIFEFGIHVIYHTLTGKAGLNDRPFSYLKDIFRQIKRGG